MGERKKTKYFSGYERKESLRTRRYKCDYNIKMYLKGVWCEDRDY
jgi:hypothetical protein